MMLKNSLTLMGLGIALLAVSSTANAAIVTVDPDGLTGSSGDIQVGSIDFLPGNALNQNAIASPLLFTNIYQSRVGALLDGNGQVILLPGLNDSTSNNKYELTVVTKFDLAATYTTLGGNLITSTSLAPNQTANFFEIWYDPSMNANDLAGTGFNDGTLILKGHATYFGGTFIEYAGIPIQLLDQFGADDWGGVLSNVGTGGAIASAAVDWANPDFFKSNIIGMNINTNNVEPYNMINPSKQFLGVNANVGSVNGQKGPDILVQADAAASIVVPEPGALAVLGLSAAGLFIRRRK